jgi:hypothetical protein
LLLKTPAPLWHFVTVAILQIMRFVLVCSKAVLWSETQVSPVALKITVEHNVPLPDCPQYKLRLVAKFRDRLSKVFLLGESFLESVARN